jgi:hypothetical protein
VADLNACRVTDVRGYVRHRLAVAPAIEAEVRAADLARIRGSRSDDELDAHAMLHRLKLAGLLALIDGRVNVDVDDWALALVVWTTSGAVRSDVARLVALEAERTEVAGIEKHARREFAAEAARRSAPAAVERLGVRLARHVHEIGDGGCTLRDLRHRTASKERMAFGPAIDHAIAADWLVERDGRFVPGESRPA